MTVVNTFDCSFSRGLWLSQDKFRHIFNVCCVSIKVDSTVKSSVCICISVGLAILYERHFLVIIRKQHQKQIKAGKKINSSVFIYVIEMTKAHSLWIGLQTYISTKKDFTNEQMSGSSSVSNPLKLTSYVNEARKTKT